MNPLARAIIASAGASAPPAFSYDDIPDQLLRINSLEGSLAFSGAVLTGVTDVSGAGETVTVTGSPVYTASDAGLNGAPSFTAVATTSSIIANVNRANVAFVALVMYAGGSLYGWDGTSSVGRHYAAFSPPNLITHRGTLAASTATEQKRLIVPFDGSTGTTMNGTSLGTQLANNATGIGMTLGARYTLGNTGSRIAFFMACSSVPSTEQLAALEAKLIEDFG